MHLQAETRDSPARVPGEFFLSSGWLRVAPFYAEWKERPQQRSEVSLTATSRMHRPPSSSGGSGCKSRIDSKSRYTAWSGDSCCPAWKRQRQQEGAGSALVRGLLRRANRKKRRKGKRRTAVNWAVAAFNSRWIYSLPGEIQSPKYISSGGSDGSCQPRARPEWELPHPGLGSDCFHTPS